MKLEGLGTFYLSAVTEGEEDPEDFTVGNIKRVRIRFLADKSKDYDWNSTSQTTRAAFSIIGNESETSNSGSSSGSNSGNSGGSNDDPDVERP